MKKALALALVLFTSFMSYVVVGGFIQKQQKENNISSNSTGESTPASTSTDTHTIDEVAKHKTSSDCWIIIDNSVYDVSSFLRVHPGGASAIIPYCGKEATKAFETQDKGSGGGHSTRASAMLSDYLIGSIVN